jgi:hypothetical protein
MSESFARESCAFITGLINAPVLGAETRDEVFTLIVVCVTDA